MTGALFINTLNVHEELAHTLVAVQVTTVLPAAKVLPEAGEQATVGAGVPVAEGVAKVTTGLHCAISAGHAPITGALFTNTLNVHEELPHELLAVHVTTVLPAANVLPEAGEQTTVGAGLPLAVGAAKVTTGLHVVMSDGQAPITAGVFTATVDVALFGQPPCEIVTVYVVVLTGVTVIAGVVAPPGLQLYEAFTGIIFAKVCAIAVAEPTLICPPAAPA